MFRSIFQPYVQIPSEEQVKKQKKSLSPKAQHFLKENSYTEALFDVMFDKKLREEEKVEIFRELVEYNPKAAVNAKFNGEDPILGVAFDSNRFEMAKILLEKGADANTVMQNINYPCLLIIRAIALVRLDFISLLMQHNASISKVVGGLSVRQVLDNPDGCLEIMYNGDIRCDAALKFKKSIGQIREIVDATLINRMVPEDTIASSPPGEKISASPGLQQGIPGVRQRTATISECDPMPMVLN